MQHNIYLYLIQIDKTKNSYLLKNIYGPVKKKTIGMC